MELDNRLYEFCQKHLIFYKFDTMKSLMYTVRLFPTITLICPYGNTYRQSINVV
jgi:hypothetical protein